MRLVGFIALAMLCLPRVASAIVTITGSVGLSGSTQMANSNEVSLATGSLSWNAVSGEVAGAETQWHVVSCGKDDVFVLEPTRSVPLVEVIQDPGTYTCTVKSANDFGVSSASSIGPFVVNT